MAWDQYEESFTDTMTVFRDAVLASAWIPSTLDDGATAARIIREAYRSAESHIVVSRITAQGGEKW